jgi:hypothetical protein
VLFFLPPTLMCSLPPATPLPTPMVNATPLIGRPMFVVASSSLTPAPAAAARKRSLDLAVFAQSPAPLSAASVTTAFVFTFNKRTSIQATTVIKLAQCNWCSTLALETSRQVPSKSSPAARHSFVLNESSAVVFNLVVICVASCDNVHHTSHHQSQVC